MLTNRRTPPDSILRVVYERSGGKPFARIDDVVPQAELQAISDNYKRVAGYDPAALKRVLPTSEPFASCQNNDPETSMHPLKKILATFLVSVSAVAAHAWPDQPITLVVPYTPGTGIDLIARQLSVRLPQPSASR